MKSVARVRALLGTAVLLAVPLASCAEERRGADPKGERPAPVLQTLTGTVTATELTHCGPVGGKPGTCEGTMELTTDGGGSPRSITLKITLDTVLRRGNEKVLLPQLDGKVVTVTFYTNERGESVAQSVSATS